MIAFMILFIGVICGTLSGVNTSKHSLHDNKEGQCPYTLNVSAKCDFNCQSDASCHNVKKCCSNGCGARCIKPLNITMCQHQKLVAQHHISQSTTQNAFIPECTEDGKFKDKQCDPVKKECWCVDFRGFEISQTRTASHNLINCSEQSYSGNCPLYRCREDCQHGFKLDKNGCRTCNCVDLCESIQCNEVKSSCTLLDVQCPNWPCPPVPLCSRPRDNPCSYGEPLKDNNVTIICGFEKQCPFTHICRSSILSNSGFCCLKEEKCPQFKCELNCRFGYSYDSNECPFCECYEPCKTVLCKPPEVCKVKEVQCIRAPCQPVPYCE